MATHQEVLAISIKRAAKAVRSACLRPPYLFRGCNHKEARHEQMYNGIHKQGDIMVIATSKRQLQRMLGELVAQATEAALKVHSGKTKVMSNDTSNRGGSLKLQRQMVDILSFFGSTAYLERELCSQDAHDVELFLLKPD